MAAFAPRATRALTCIEHIVPPPPVQKTTSWLVEYVASVTLVFENVWLEYGCFVRHGDEVEVPVTTDEADGRKMSLRLET